MHYIAIAIFDSENSSLKDKVDAISNESKLAMEQMIEKWKNDSFDQILNDSQNPPPKIQAESALIEMFREKLEKPLNRLIDKEFDNYTIDNVLPVDKLLKDFENKDYDRYPRAILTPSYEWIKEDWNGNYKEGKRLSEEWNKKVFDLLNKYKDKGVVVSINCDS